MKIYKNPISILMVILLLGMTECTYQETDFGFDGSINGTIKDENGNLLYGDLNSNNIIVRLLGDTDKETTDIRVKGDGTYQNLKMFPKMHKVWVEGPIVKSDTVYVDFSSQLQQNVDFIVNPLISPSISNEVVSGTSITIDYSIIPSSGKSVSKKEIYCSTVIYPTASIGSMQNVYTTKTVTLPSALTGKVTITALQPGTKYFLRLGVQATGSKLMNYSNQIEVTLQ